jgi:hypothetical protein
MPSADYLIGSARGEIRRYPAIGGQPPAAPSEGEPRPWPWSRPGSSATSCFASPGRRWSGPSGGGTTEASGPAGPMACVIMTA